jgi:septum formation protein
MSNQTTQVILASGSPRRRELLSAMGVAFDVIPSRFEEQLDDNRSPEDVARELALGKAKDVAAQFPDRIVIGADTIVTIDGRQLGKPADEVEARAMLQMLAGREHEVTTGVAILRLSDGVEYNVAETANVYFRPYDEALASEYIKSGDPFDKAGGYGIQSGASPFIDSILGNYDTIIGFPTKLVAEYLTKLGIGAQPAELEPTVPQRTS